MTNLNDMAKRITLKEGKKMNLSIAQVREVMRLMLLEVKELTLAELTTLLRRFK